MSSSLPSEVQQALLHLLAGLSSADNTTRSHAEKSLYEEWSKEDRIEMLLLFLAEQSSSGESNQVKAFSAVLFRRVALKTPNGTGFSVTARQIDHISANVKAQIRRVLLQGFISPQSNDIRHKLADAISEVSKDGEWPELLPALFQAAKNEESSFRESAFRVFSSSPELIDKSYINEVLPIFHAGFEDSNDDVRIAAANAFVAFFQQIPKKSWSSLSPLLPSLLNSLPRLLENGKDESLASVFESLIELVELAPKMFKPMFTTVIEFCSMVAKNKELDQSTRLAALELLVTFSESSSTMCKREASYTSNIVLTTLQMMTEVSIDDDDASEWNNSDDREDDENELEYDAARQSLDRVALRLTGQSLAAPLFQYIPSMLQSQEWRERHAALMAVSSAAEGCRDVLITEIPKILDLILPALNDQHPRVQYACCNALGQISTDFADVIQRTSGDRIIPALILMLNNRNVPRVQTHAAAALVNFSENATKEVLEPYLDDLLSNLLTLLQSPKRYVQEQVLTTIAIIADAAQTKFIKYYDTLMPLLLNVLKTEMGEENRLLKAKCIECSTLIALAVGKEKFAQHTSEIIQLFAHIQEAAVEDDDPVKPYLEQGWGRICRIIGKDFLPFLPGVLPPLLQAAKATQDLSLIDEDDVDELGANDDWDVIQLSGKHIAIHTALLDDKTTAIELLKNYADVLEGDFFPYVKEISQDIVIPAIDFYLHDGVRGSAALTMPSLLKCCILATAKTSQQSLELWKQISDKLIDAIQHEPVPELLVAYYSSFVKCLEIMGTDSLSDHQLTLLANAVDNNLKEIYQRIKEREVGEDEYVDENEEDDDELTDEELLDEINKSISVVFKNAKSRFIPGFQVMVPTIAQYINDDNTSIKLCGLCVISDLIEFSGENSYHFKDMFMNVIGESLTSPQASIRRATAYSVGVAAQHGGPNYRDFCLATLEPMFKMCSVLDAKAEENAAATENSVAAIAKICHSFGNTIPNFDVIVENWFKLLPVLQDDEAAPYAYNFLVELIAKQHPVVINQIPKVVDDVVQALTYNSISGKTAQRIVEATKQLLGTIPQNDAMNLLSKYSTEAQQVIQKWFS
ncbi:hypothetical protein PACTADRAFT_74674 [Pachysolen tannophilus NRRL Y-2460]|uniref:TOG domain-containing protein n=1 Tax=Pachysolen tannophilus NRRL Y-2460 TaxID=669874 RepID=A0A1E4TZE5_PACTA|nr:hypothetical protein PACTADRAFT_74674 [Pachysolen tannophilus NRRL Y-2460]